MHFLNGRKKVTCYVVFGGGGAHGPWRLWTKPGWRHCFVLVTVYHPAPSLHARRFLAKVEAFTGFLDVDVWWNSPEDACRLLHENGATAIVKITVDLPPRRLWVPRGVITCVSVPKAVLGICNWRIVTPWRLFQHLLQTGGELVKIEG